MDQKELKIIKKIYNQINSIAKVGKNNYLEYFYYVDELVNKGQYSDLNTSLFLNYGIDYTKYNTIYDLKNQTWDIICFQTLTPLDEKLKILYRDYNIYQLGRDIYSNDLSYYEISVSLPLSYTYSYTEYTSQFTLFEKDGQINLKLIDRDIYQIEVYKDYLIQIITSGTYSTLYESSGDEFKISDDEFTTKIPLDTSKYEIVTYRRDQDLIGKPVTPDQISNYKENTIYKYNVYVTIKNLLGTINEIDSNDYLSGKENTYYNKYSDSYYNKNEIIDNTLGLKRTYLNVVKYKGDDIEGVQNIIHVNPYYSEGLNLYWRYVSAIEYITNKKIYKGRDLNRGIYAVWNSESIIYSLYNLLYSSFNGNDLSISNYGVLDIERVGDITIEKLDSNSVFNFVSGYLKLPDDSLKFTDNFCINMKFILSDYNTKQKIISCYNKYENDIYGWFIDIGKNTSLNINNTEIGFNARMSDYKMYRAVFYIPDNLLNDWINICINYNKSGFISLYLNGIYFSSYSLQQSDLYILYSTVNRCSVGSGTYLKSTEDRISENSKIDFIHTWSRNLTDSEIYSIYNKGTGMKFPFTGLIESSNDWLNVWNATMSNVTISKEGKVGKCFLFGNESYISLPKNSLNINNFAEFSISMWINFKSIGMTQSILSCKDVNNNGYDVVLNNDNKIKISYLKDSYLFNSIGGPIFTANNWFLLNISMVKQSDRFIFNLWINAKKYLENVQIDSVEPISNMKPIIGANLNSGSFSNYISVGSKIDSISVWDKALFLDDIEYLFNNGSGREYPFNMDSPYKPVEEIPMNSIVPDFDSNSLEDDRYVIQPETTDFPDETIIDSQNTDNSLSSRLNSIYYIEPIEPFNQNTFSVEAIFSSEESL
jgi:hypothetical protein